MRALYVGCIGTHAHGRQAGFALPIAIVAKCEEILNFAQKIVIWRQLLAKEKSPAKFFVWPRNVTYG